MNIQPQGLKTQVVFFPQRLPAANIVKPKILLNRSPSPINTAYSRVSNHFSSPNIPTVFNTASPPVLSQNSGSYIQKPMFYSPATNFEQVKKDNYCRNLSPQAAIVLDILNKIKSTNIFQKNKQKFYKENVFSENKSEINNKENLSQKEETSIKEEQKNNEDSLDKSPKQSIFKRSCGCSPKNSPKHLNNQFKLDDKTNIEILKVNLKSSSPRNKDRLKLINEDIKRGKSPPKGILSPKSIKSNSSPKNKDSSQKVAFIFNNKGNENLHKEGDVKNDKSKDGSFLESPKNKNPEILIELYKGSFKKREQTKENLKDSLIKKEITNENFKDSLIKKDHQLKDSVIKKEIPNENLGDSFVNKEENDETSHQNQNGTKKSEYEFNDQELSINLYNRDEISKKSPKRKDKNGQINSPNENSKENFLKRDLLVSENINNEESIYKKNSEYLISSSKDGYLTNNLPFFHSQNLIEPNEEKNIGGEMPSKPSPIQDLLGKINQCLSKTSNILSLTYAEEKKSSLNDNKTVSEQIENNDNMNDIKITTSPVKEFQIETNYNNFNVQTQITRNFQENSDEKTEKNLNKSNEYIDETLQTPHIAKIINSQLKDSFSPIPEKNENDEDKENNTPFINVYQQKTNAVGLPLSPKETVVEINKNLQENFESDENAYKKDEDPVSSPKREEEKAFAESKVSIMSNQAIKGINKSQVNKNKKNPTQKEKDGQETRIKIFNSEKNIANKNINKQENLSSKKMQIQISSYSSPPKKQLKTSNYYEKNNSGTYQKNENKLSKSGENDNIAINSSSSYSKIAKKSNKKKEGSEKNMTILKQINNIDQEIQALEKETQKDRIDIKMMKFYDNYKAYRHKLPSIQENEESLRKKSQLEGTSPKTQTLLQSNKKNLLVSSQLSKVTEERCNYLYTKGLEASKKRQKEVEENQKKLEMEEISKCTFKPEFVSKKNNELLLSSREKPFKKPIIKSIADIPSHILPKTKILRSSSQNNEKKGQRNDLNKLNKSLSPPKQFFLEKKKKATKSQTSSNNRKWISPRSETSSKTLRNNKGNMQKIPIIEEQMLLESQNIYSSPLLKKSPVKNTMDNQLTGEIFDILKIFSGINEVLAHQVPKKPPVQSEMLAKEKEKALDKIRDISPIKPQKNDDNTNNIINKSFNEVSLGDMSLQNQQDRKSSLDHVIGLLDQKQQNLLLKSIEMTKKVDYIFKENSGIGFAC